MSVAKVQPTVAEGDAVTFFEDADAGAGSGLTGSSSGSSTCCSLDSVEDVAFFMYQFKVVPCSNPEAHDCQECPFAHPSEKATRRDPRIHKYTGVSCPSYRKGSCKDGDGCPYAHGVFEVWLHPSKFRTELCTDGLSCTRKCCFFAHTPAQLRQPAAQDACLPPVPDRSQKPQGNSNGGGGTATPQAKPAGIVRRTASSANVSIAAHSSILPAGSSVSRVSPSDPGSILPTAASGLSQALSTAACRPGVAATLVSSSNGMVPGRLPAVLSALGSLLLSSSPAPAAVPVQLYTGGGAFSGLPLQPAVVSGVQGCSQPLLPGLQQLQPGTDASSSRMIPVPLDIALEAALLSAAAGPQPQLPVVHGPLADVSLLQDSSASWALAGSGPGLTAAAAGLGSQHCDAGLLAAFAATQGLAGRQGLQQQPGPVLAAPAAMQQLLAAQHDELMAALLLECSLGAPTQQRQPQLKQHAMQQQQQDQMGQMWLAAYQAALGVGLQSHEAAVCADCAVKQTVAGSAAEGAASAGVPTTLGLPLQVPLLQPAELLQQQQPLPLLHACQGQHVQAPSNAAAASKLAVDCFPSLWNITGGIGLGVALQ